MLYNLHFYRNDELKEVITDNVFMIGEGNRFVSLDVPCYYDKMMLFCEDKRYIATYYYVSRYKGKSVFERR